MHIIGEAKDKRIVSVTCAELLMIEGKQGAIVEGMYPSGAKIDVARQFAILTANIGREAKLQELANDMKKAAEDIEKGLEK